MKVGWDGDFCGEIKEAWEKKLREIDELVNGNVDCSSHDDPIVWREFHGFQM